MILYTPEYNIIVRLDVEARLTAASFNQITKCCFIFYIMKFDLFYYFNPTMQRLFSWDKYCIKSTTIL